MTNLSFRPLGVIKELLDNCGFSITYLYEDLIFIEHNAFLLQMGEKGEELFVCFNVDSTPEERPGIFSLLKDAGNNMGFVIEQRGTYQMTQQEGEENFQLEFL